MLIIIRDPWNHLLSSRSELGLWIDFLNASNQITMNSWSGNLCSSETYVSEPYSKRDTLWYPVMWFSVMLWNLEEMVTAQFLPLKASQILGSTNHPRLYPTSISLHARHNVLQIIKVIYWQRWLSLNFYLNFSVILCSRIFGSFECIVTTASHHISICWSKR